MNNIAKKLVWEALNYAYKLNWTVFPVHGVINGECTCKNKYCYNPGKHPVIKDWPNNATNNEETIYHWWWENWRNSNIGVPTGQKNGFFVLDIDPKNGGFESLRQLINRYGELPDTVKAITGSKGVHYFFKCNGEIKNSVNLLPGIDIRGEGGYIVVSPSVHKNGNQYYWESSSSPFKVPIAEPPNWLMYLLRTNRTTDKIRKYNSEYWDSIFNNTIEGNRNNAAAKLIGHLLRRFVDPGLVLNFVHLWNRYRVTPPLSKAELNKTFNSIYERELERRKNSGK